MKLKRIISVIFILLILCANSLIIFAEETEEDDYETIDINEQDVSESDISIANYIDIDTSNYNGYIKPSTNEYDDANGHIYQDEYFASYYFKALKNNFGYNTHGSCGYVAAAMMLSYYDTYLDDNIIPEQYDKEGFINSNFDVSNINNESPGINREPEKIYDANGNKIRLDSLSVEDYWNFIVANWTNHFQLNLIKLAEEEFNMYHEVLTILEECNISAVSSAACASTMLQQKNLL